MTNEELLEKFGRILISEVRDEAIDKFQMIADGKINSTPAVRLSEKLAAFTNDQLAIIREVVVSSIDDAVHNFLWMLEQHEDDIDLLCSEDEESDKRSIRGISDGLSGEIYTEDGWIAKYSNYKENY